MTLYEKYEGVIKKRLKEEYGDVSRIENLDIISVFEFDKNDYHVSEDYPIIDKGYILIETEYYIDGKGSYRCFAVEQYTGKFLDIDSNILSIFIKISGQISKLGQEIKILDFKKVDDKNVKLKRFEIVHENGITTISEKTISEKDIEGEG